MFFFPGATRGSDVPNEPICNVFCPLHAADIYFDTPHASTVFYPPDAKCAPVVRLGAPKRRRSSQLERVDRSRRRAVGGSARLPGAWRGREETIDVVEIEVDVERRSSTLSQAKAPPKRESPSRKRSHSKISIDPAFAKSLKTEHAESDDEEDSKPAAKPRPNIKDESGARHVQRKRLSAVSEESSAGSSARARSEQAPVAEVPGAFSHGSLDGSLTNQECQGITLQSLLSESESTPSDVVKGFAKLASQAVEGLADAIRAGKSWPLNPCEWHGALFPANAEDPWWYVCCFRSSLSSSSLLPLSL